jgi:hypothetical protein
MMKRTISVDIESIGSRILLVVVAVATLALGTGCKEGKEGDRCNPALVQPGYNEDECNGGLTCQQSPTCAEAYCCPTPLTSSLNPFCNGSACPPPDAGP